MEGILICLLNNNLRFPGILLLQTNGTVTGATNSCPYSKIAIRCIDKPHNRDICLVLWCRDIQKLNNFKKLKLTMGIGEYRI